MANLDVVYSSSFMVRLNLVVTSVLTVILCWVGAISADYTLVLKNGRRITVQSYREEGGMIRFYGLGGEIGIAKDQVQSILKAGEAEGRGMDFPGIGRSPAMPEPGDREEKSAEAKEKGLTPEEALAEQRAKEEKEYQRRVRELTEKIKSTQNRYQQATRGSSGSDPTLLNSEEAIRARADDLTSRLRDAQHNPSGPADAGGVRLTTPSPFTGVPPTATELRPGAVVPRVDTPPPSYTARERELSDLRNQIIQFERERDRLIQEMRQKNFETGSFFLE